MGAGPRSTRTIALVAAVGLIALAGPTSAGAAATIGQTFTPPLSGDCTEGFTWLDPHPDYFAPSAGIITSWSFQAGSAPPQLKFKVARPVPPPGTWTIVGESGLVAPVANTLNTYSVRIPAQDEDLIGFYVATFGGCLNDASAGHTAGVHFGDDAPGATNSYSAQATTQLDVSATLEPDADNDGFGDESQDNCPTIANPDQADNDADGIGNVCDSTPDGEPDTAAPDTTITKGPKDKTKKKQATFEFTGTDARAVASFQCSLDGGPVRVLHLALRPSRSRRASTPSRSGRSTRRATSGRRRPTTGRSRRRRKRRSNGQ